MRVTIDPLISVFSLAGEKRKRWSKPITLVTHLLNTWVTDKVWAASCEYVRCPQMRVLELPFLRFASGGRSAHFRGDGDVLVLDSLSLRFASGFRWSPIEVVKGTRNKR
jgi:hypothetical protein